MSQTPQRDITSLETVSAFLSVGVFIGFCALGIPEHLGASQTKASIFLIVAADALSTYLIMSLLMPIWGVSGMETLRLRRQAEGFALWSALHHPLKEQRIVCAIRKALLAQARGDLEEALRFAEMAMAWTEDRIDQPSGSFSYARCLGVRGEVRQAERQYQEALEDFAVATRLHLKPPSLSAQYYAKAAGTLYCLGRFDEAVLFAEQAIAGLSDAPSAVNSEAHRWAALSLAELGRGQEAVTHCELGMFIQPITLVNVWLIADYPWLLFLAGRETEAEANFTEIEPMAKTDGLSLLMQQEYQETLGRVRLLQGKLEAAKALFTASLDDPMGQNISALYHLALIAQQEGDAEAAQAYRERLLKESPQSFYAQRLRDRIPPLGNVV